MRAMDPTCKTTQTKCPLTLDSPSNLRRTPSPGPAKCEDHNCNECGIQKFHLARQHPPKIDLSEYERYMLSFQLQ